MREEGQGRSVVELPKRDVQRRVLWVGLVVLGKGCETVLDRVVLCEEVEKAALVRWEVVRFITKVRERVLDVGGRHSGDGQQGRGVIRGAKRESEKQLGTDT